MHREMHGLEQKSLSATAIGHPRAPASTGAVGIPKILQFSFLHVCYRCETNYPSYAYPCSLF